MQIEMLSPEEMVVLVPYLRGMMFYETPPQDTEASVDSSRPLFTGNDVLL